eukprot:g8648.t1
MEIRAIDKDVEIPLLKARSATPDIVNVEKTKNGRSTQAIDALFWKRARFYSPLLRCALPEYWSNLFMFMLKYAALVSLKIIIGYFGAKLRLEWRTILVTKIQSQIYSQKNLANYLVNIQNCVDNVDQRVAEDVEVTTIFLWQFFFGNTTSKGIIESSSDVCVALVALYNLGYAYVALILLYNVLFLIINFVVMRPVVKLQFFQQVLEGAFRFVHLHIREFSESITFYRGLNAAKSTSNRAFEKVYANQMKYIDQEALVEFVRQYFNLLNPIYCFAIIIFVPPSVLTASAGGFAKVSVIFSTLQSSLTPILTIVALSSQLAKIAGTVHRVGDLLEKINVASVELRVDEETRMRIRIPSEEALDEAGFKEIRLWNVSCIVPSQNSNSVRRVLFSDLSLVIRPGQHTLIVGPSGSGKTSLLRILGGIWPISGIGKITKPDKIGAGGIFFLPQRPYLSLGTLREQCIYPHTMKNMHDADIETLDKKLRTYLQLVRMEHLLNDYAFDSLGSWSDIFSGGEQQRIGFVRVLYHRPLYCIMDEATSALDVKLEGMCMNACIKLDVTCISVGHRATLIKFHSQRVSLIGDGTYCIDELNRVETTGLSPDYLRDRDATVKLPQKASKRRGISLLSQAHKPYPSSIGLGNVGESHATSWFDLEKLKIILSRLLRVLKIGFGGEKKETIQVIAAVGCQILFVYANISLVNKYFNPNILSKLSNRGNPLSDIVFYAIIISIMGVLFVLSQWLPRRVGLKWRHRLVGYFHDKYLKFNNVYTINHLKPDIDNVDQRIATDVKQFASSMKSSDFMDNVFGYGGLLGTLINFIVAIAVGNLSFGLVFSTLVYASLTMFAMGFLMYRVAKSRYVLCRHEGDFRRSIARSYEFAESVAFYGGENTEYENGQVSYTKLTHIYKDFIKTDYQLQGLRAFTGTFSILLSSAFYVVFVVEPTCNPSTMTLIALMGGNFVVQQLITSVVSIPTSISLFSTTLGNMNRISILSETLELLDDTSSTPSGVSEDSIIVSNVSCKIPLGHKQLFKNLTFTVGQADSVIIMGPSGSGKTSLVRLLAGLWSADSGAISKPEKIGKNGLFFLPQRPYLTLGTLRAQLLYPSQEEDRQAYNDDTLKELLKLVKMDHLIASDDGLNTVAPWNDVLSGGEKQKIGFIRLFYHKPKFCIMDEATAALDEDSEQICMTECISRKITFISVGHRSSLLKYHKRKIMLKPSGNKNIGSTYRIETLL